MYAGMKKDQISQIKDQISQIKALVDRGGWAAVRNHPVLSQVWAKSVAESRKWVDENIRN